MIGILLFYLRDVLESNRLARERMPVGYGGRRQGRKMRYTVAGTKKWPAGGTPADQRGK